MCNILYMLKQSILKQSACLSNDVKSKKYRHLVKKRVWDIKYLSIGIYVDIPI